MGPAPIKPSVGGSASKLKKLPLVKCGVSFNPGAGGTAADAPVAKRLAGVQPTPAHTAHVPPPRTPQQFFETLPQRPTYFGSPMGAVAPRYVKEVESFTPPPAKMAVMTISKMDRLTMVPSRMFQPSDQ